jgi:hypothetical protein
MHSQPPFPLLAVHAGATLFLVGLIWFVQMVHYPLFAAVGTAGFAAYAEAHAERTTWVVAPVMLIELVSALSLLRYRLPRAAVVAGVVLLAIVWASTFLLQVPRHGILAGGFDAAAHQGLVATNWLRTAAWTARGILALRLLKP